MQILSALDAVSPAIARTKLVLYTPFRAGRTWKLSASAYLSFAGTLFFPFPFIYLIFIPQAWRWTAAKMALGVVMVAVMAAPLAVYVRHVMEIMKQMGALQPGAQPPPELFMDIFAGYGIILLVGGSFYLIVATLDSFVVPSLALEDVSMGEAFRRVGNLIRYEPGQFVLYIVVKIGIGVAGYMGIIFAFEIAAIIVGLLVALVAGLIGFLLHLIGVPMALLWGLGIFVAIAFYIVVVGYGMVLAIGPLFTFMQAYTLYFLGGRYPLVGELLDRSTPPPAPHSMPPPSFVYPPAPSGSAPQL
jgi:hypothetical protein